MGLVIDTSVLIEVEKGNMSVISKLEKLKKTPNDEIIITFFTLCEFYNGLVKKTEKNRQEARERMSKYIILNTTKEAALIFSEIFSKLKQNGKQIPVFDIMIAAVSVAHNLPLVTLDAHFKEISELKSIIIK